MPCLPRPHRHEQLDSIREVAQEGERGHALWQARDAAEAQHEAVLLRQLLHRPLLLLEAGNEAAFILRGKEAGQQLQEVQAKGLEVIPGGRGVGIAPYPLVLESRTSPSLSLIE